MRFVFAIIAFVVAAVMIVAGIAQRTVFAPPSQIAAVTTVKGDPRYIVIDGAVLNAHPGQQTLSVSGGDTKSQVVAYGRTADVKAWLGSEKYVSLGLEKATGDITMKAVTGKTSTGDDDESTATPTPTPTAGAPAADPAAPAAPAAPADGSAEGDAAAAPDPNPAGSDLWLEEFDGDDAQVTRMNVPDSISVIVAGDGTKAAPNQIRVTWPVDSSTPFAFPLIIGGLVLLVIGIGLYLWGLYALRKSRGPRRTGGPKMPKLPKAPKYKPSKAVEATPKGRRSTRRAMVAVPITLAGALALSGCSVGSVQSSSVPIRTASPVATEAPKAKDQLPPAVTVPQLDRIVKRISATAVTADAKADPAIAKERFAGPALQLREANYAIRAKKADEPALPAIPASPIVLSLPQATDTWPRTVTAVVDTPKDAKGAAQAPLALTLVQETPRDNYLVTYAVSLEPKAKVPNLAPASIGSAVVPPDSKLLKVRPDALAAAYGDVLMNGDASKSAALFSAEGDTLRTQVGSEWKAQQKAELQQKFGATSSLEFTSAVGSGPDIAMATNDSGAIVWVNLEETQTLRVVEAGAEVDAGPTSAALSGVASSKTGIASTYGYQLAFYVPPAGSSSKITLLGFAQGLVSAKEVQ